MDERLADLDRRVAEAADAWLTDPRDVGVYARLVSAIEARRAYLHPELPLETHEQPAMRPLDATGQAPDQPEVLDELDQASVQAVGTALAGDVRAVLDRLRASQR